MGSYIPLSREKRVCLVCVSYEQNATKKDYGDERLTVVTKNTYNGNGLLVAHSNQVMSVSGHLVANKVGLNNLRFNIKEPEKLLPGSLVNRADN